MRRAVSSGRTVPSVIAALALGVMTAGAASAAAPTPTPIVPAGSQAAYYDSMQAVAGTADYLAYTRSTVGPGGPSVDR